MGLKKTALVATAGAAAGAAAGAVGMYRSYRRSDSDDEQDYTSDRGSNRKSKIHRRPGRRNRSIPRRHESSSEYDHQLEYNNRHPYKHQHYSRRLSRSSSNSSDSDASSASSPYAALEANTNNILTRYEAEPNHELVRYAHSSAPSSVSSNGASSWIWDNDKKSYYYISSDGQTRIWQDGKNESLNLRPPPVPKAPTRIRDEARNMWCWRDETNKCWVYENSMKIEDKP